MTLNVVSGALAVTAVVLYSVDLAMGTRLYCNTDYYSSYSTSSPADTRKTEICEEYKYLARVIIVIFAFYLSKFQFWGSL